MSTVSQSQSDMWLTDFDFYVATHKIISIESNEFDLFLAFGEWFPIVING